MNAITPINFKQNPKYGRENFKGYDTVDVKYMLKKK